MVSRPQSNSLTRKSDPGAPHQVEAVPVARSQLQRVSVSSSLAAKRAQLALVAAALLEPEIPISNPVSHFGHPEADLPPLAKSVPSALKTRLAWWPAPAALTVPLDAGASKLRKGLLA